MKKKVGLLFLLLFFAGYLPAVPTSELYIVAADGTFLGTLDENDHAASSIYNENGIYGSKYSANSIYNRYGNYGSDFSDYSPFNKSANNAPWIVDKDGNFYGCLSLNKSAEGVTDYTYNLAKALKRYRDFM